MFVTFIVFSKKPKKKKTTPTPPLRKTNTFMSHVSRSSSSIVDLFVIVRGRRVGVDNVYCLL